MVWTVCFGCRVTMEKNVHVSWSVLPMLCTGLCTDGTLGPFGLLCAKWPQGWSCSYQGPVKACVKRKFAFYTFSA